LNTTTKITTYPIVETFHSLQGEGYWAGVSAFFIRLGGCDVHCSWCDTKNSWNPQHHPQQSITELAVHAQAVKPAIVVITGGEPLMHDLIPLTTALKQKGLQVHLETSGAHPLTGDFDWITFSPKQFKAPHSSIYEAASELKVVVTGEYDLKWAEQQRVLVSKSALCYLQPEWNSPQSKNFIFDYILQHPQWRVSLQTHKLLNIQ
jgi:7-carboxy-7-deazaguanine synthase